MKQSYQKLWYLMGVLKEKKKREINLDIFLSLMQILEWAVKEIIKDIRQ